MYRNIDKAELRIDKGTGYYYFLDKEHPLATGKAHRILFHRHIMSVSIGRWITSKEVVHHIDHNKLNNNIENLELLSQSEHMQLHCLEQGMTLHRNLPCEVCGKPITKFGTKFCSVACTNESFIRFPELTKEILDDLIPKHTWIALGKMFGYSDNGIKKRARSLGCTIPVRRKT